MHKTVLLLLALTLGCVTAFAALPVTQAEAASTKTKKKTNKGRDDYTPEQRKKMMERARQICIKHHGVGSRVYKLDYKKMMVTCTETGY